MPGRDEVPELDWAAASAAARDEWLSRFVTGRDGAAPPYTTCPSVEHELLIHVRRSWAADDVSAFADVLWQIYETRHQATPVGRDEPLLFLDTLPVLYHNTGDYAHAAYLARRRAAGPAAETMPHGPDPR